MICPDCKADNIPGADQCESCGTDLHSFDLPSAEDTFTHHLLHDRLGDLDVPEAVGVAPDEPVALAVHAMQQRGVECVLVREGDRLVGILTESDILMKAAGDKQDLNAVAVRQLMSGDPVCLREDDTLAVALHEMSVGGFRHIPLLANGRAGRVVSIQDVFRHVSTFLHEQPAPAP